jgi:C4-dicarboxylate transporter/malic acid transport protein
VTAYRVGLVTTESGNETPPTSDRIEVLGNIGPNWFASVMGTGIVATAGATLPVKIPGLHTFTQIVWAIAAILLVFLILVVGGHWVRNPTVARSHARNPQMAHFYGAAPMALMTVGVGTLLIGGDLIGQRLAVNIDWVLWTAGTVGGLFTAVSIPFLMFTQHSVEPDSAFGGWLMPIVPPMVSAASGALLIPHIDSVTGRQTMLYGCYAMFGLSLVAAFIIISMIWSRLVIYGTSGTARVPTLWIVLGPLGQSITAAGLLGASAAKAVGPQMADNMNAFAILYGVPVWGFALLWIALAASLTVRTMRRGMPFALTWWSLTFPVGTFVTGTTQLARLTSLPAFQVAAAVAYLGLLCTWLTVAVRTARGTRKGHLLRPPANPAPIKPRKEPIA